MTDEFRASPLWKSLQDTWPETFSVTDPHWRTHGVVAGALKVRELTGDAGYRYFMTMLMHIVNQSAAEDVSLYEKIPNRSFGDPYEVKVAGQRVCIDYYRSVQEYKRLRDFACSFNGAKMLEIGAGYGRLVHTLLSLESGIAAYYVVDLPFTLNVCKTYLKAVLSPDLFAKVHFIDALTEFPGSKLTVLSMFLR